MAACHLGGSMHCVHSRGQSHDAAIRGEFFMEGHDFDKQAPTGSEATEGAIPPDWLAEFEAAAQRPLETRFRYAFIHTYKPVLDDAAFRSFNSMEEYRQWCEQNLPAWLGYARV